MRRPYGTYRRKSVLRGLSHGSCPSQYKEKHIRDDPPARFDKLNGLNPELTERSKGEETAFRSLSLWERVGVRASRGTHDPLSTIPTHPRTGRRSPTRVACSNAYASWSTPNSS